MRAPVRAVVAGALLAGGVAGVAAIEVRRPGVQEVVAGAVTLRPVDGGAGYFAKWANSLPTDASFFPIGVWQETLADLSWVEDYRDLGVNTFVGLYNGTTPQMAERVRANGMYIVGGVDYALSGGEADPGDVLAARHFADEPDGIYVCDSQPSWLKALCTGVPGQYTDPSAIKAMSDEVRRRDPSRPVFNQFTKPIAIEGYAAWAFDEAERRTYATAGDITSFDYYPITDPWSPGSVWSMYTATQRARFLADYTRPVWTFIETSDVFANATRRPTDAQIVAEVWNAVIGGARGIEYFNHNFKAGRETQRVLIDPRYASTADAVKGVNLRIKNLAPVINSPFADGLVTTSGAMNVMAKYDGSSYYVFAIPNRTGSQSVTFSLTGITSGTATVVDEGRNVAISGGAFTDTFANENTVHIYKITAGTTPPTTGPTTTTTTPGPTTTAAPTTTTTAPPTTPPPSGRPRPVAAFGFDEGAGTVVDDSIGTATGSLTGATWTTGKFGSALNFDGANDRVVIPDSAALDVTGQLTLSAWVRPTATTSWRTVVLKERPGGLAYALYASDEANRPSAYINLGQAKDDRATAPAPLTAGQWAHLTQTYDGTTLRLYVNGALAASRTVTGTVTTSTGVLTIGGNAIWNEWFAGTIDEVRIYNQALTADQVAADMHTPVTGGAAAGRMAADFDGDGTTERGVYRPATGTWYVEGGSTVHLGLPGDIPVSGDYDGDGVTERAVYRPSTGGWYVEGLPTVYLGVAGDLPVPGDYDGDGVTERAVFRPSTGGWYVEGLSTVFFGTAGDVPVPGDYDGDGVTERAVYRKGSGSWFVEGAATVHLGLAADIPVPADFDGDGDVDPAVYRPASGAWFVQGQSTAFFGLPGDVPVPDDYDGDGDADAALFRASAGAWYVSATATTYLGLPTDIPVTAVPAVYASYFKA